jgi:hypothetical protein
MNRPDTSSRDVRKPVIVGVDMGRPPPVILASAITAAFKSERFEHSDFIIHALDHLKNAEVFEFGELPDSFLRTESVRGGKLMNAGHLSLPYKAVAFWYTLIIDEASRSRTLAMFKDKPELADEIEVAPTGQRVRYCTLMLGHENYIAAFDLMRLDGEWLEMAVGDNIEIGLTYYMLVNAALIQGTTDDRWQGLILLDKALPFGGDLSDEGRSVFIGGLADVASALSLMVATRGVEVRVEPAPVKLNAKRAKRGKPALPRVTHVNTLRYFTALQNTQRGGTHASPVPHLRRGHMRHYAPDTPRGGRDGKTVWIRDTIVNARSMDEVIKRDHYEVQTGDTHGT